MFVNNEQDLAVCKREIQIYVSFAQMLYHGNYNCKEININFNLFKNGDGYE